MKEYYKRRIKQLMETLQEKIGNNKTPRTL